MKNERSVSITAGGGGSPEPATEWHPQCNPGEKLNVILNSERSERDSGSAPHCELVSKLSSRTRFGIWPTLLVVRHSGQMLKQVQHDKSVLACVGFTMAEILLSLTIIGVVAAITLPSLTGNINERTWNTQRKALYARFSQAMSLMPSLNGYGTFREVTDSDTGSTSMEDTAAETFITAGLSKVLKINNICDSEHLKDCGLPDKIIPYSGSVITPFPDTMLTLNSALQYGSGSGIADGTANIPDTKVAAFETANGESIAVYYNPRCVQTLSNWSSGQYNRVCANFIYDLNGTKGPNAYGKDIGFITAFNPVDPVVAAPYVLPGIAGHGTFRESSARCKTLDENARIPNDYEMSAMSVNKKLIGYIGLNNPYWVSEIVRINADGSKNYFVQYWTDNIDSRWEWAETDNGTSLCVRRD